MPWRRWRSRWSPPTSSTPPPTGCSSTAAAGLPALGVPGAAWATMASRALHGGGAVAGRPPLRPRARQRLRRRCRGTSRALRLARLWRLGFPAALQISIEVGAFALATALAGRLDPVSSASHQIALNIAATAFMVPLGIASAGAVRVGNRVGAGDPQGAARAGWTAIALGGVFMSATVAALRDHAARPHRRSSRPVRTCSPWARRCCSSPRCSSSSTGCRRWPPGCCAVSATRARRCASTWSATGCSACRSATCCASRSAWASSACGSACRPASSSAA